MSKNAVPPKLPIRNLTKYDVDPATINKYMNDIFWFPLANLSKWNVNGIRLQFQDQWRRNALKRLNTHLKSIYPNKGDRKMICLLVLEAYYEVARQYLHALLP